MRAEIKDLTAIRGVAALVVFLAHFQFERVLAVLEIPARLWQWEAAAVDLFFILSGFVLFHVHGQHRGRLRYIGYVWVRIARVFPLHLATLAFSLFVVWVMWAHAGGGDWEARYALKAVVANVLLIQTWPGLHLRSVVGPAWALSVEWFLYLALFPLLRLLPVVRKQHFERVLVVALSVGLALVSEGGRWGEAVLVSAIPRGILGFTLGWLIHRCYLEREATFRFAARYRGVLLIAVGGVIVITGWLGAGTNWLAVLWPWVILALAAAEAEGRPPLAGRILHGLGLASYSLYLWHYPIRAVLEIATRYQITEQSLVVRSIYVLGCVVGVPLFSYFSYRWFEDPARCFLRRLGARHLGGG